MVAVHCARMLQNQRQADAPPASKNAYKEQQLLATGAQLTSRAVVQLYTPQDQVGDSRKHNGQFEAHIHTVRLINQATYGASDRCRSAINREYLGKTKAGTYQTNHHRYYCSPANWEFTARIPIIDIVASMTEYNVFDDENDCIWTQPVCNEDHETVKCLIKVAANKRKSKRDCDIRHCPDKRPHIPLDTHESLTEHLHGETEAIIVWNIVSNRA